MITVILMSLITHAEWKTLTELPSGHLPILLTIKYATKIENTTERLQIIKKKSDYYYMYRRRKLSIQRTNRNPSLTQ